MVADAIVHSGSRRRRRTWRPVIRLFLLLLFLAVVGAGVLLGWRWYTGREANQRLDAIVAKLDKEDPGWRLEEIEAKRPKFADDENGAVVVKEAIRDVSRPDSLIAWPAAEKLPVAPVQDDAAAPPAATIAPAYFSVFLANYVSDTLPTQRFAGPPLDELRRIRDEHADRIANLQRLALRPNGRHHVQWSEDGWATLMPHIHWVQGACELLYLEAFLLAEDGNTAAALHQVHLHLTAARTLEGEPTAISMIWRIRSHASACRSLERVLAQAAYREHEVPLMDRPLAMLQRELELPAASDILRQSIRAERAFAQRLGSAMTSGKVSPEDVLGGHPQARKRDPSWRESISEWFSQPTFVAMIAIALEEMTDLLDKLGAASVAEQRRILAQAEAEAEAAIQSKSAPPERFLVNLLLGGAGKANEMMLLGLSRSECARVGLACERFRLQHGRWPSALAELCPRYLARVPIDPYSEKELKLLRTEEGIVIYSVGPDGVDNRGVVNMRQPNEPGTDIAFRLYDPAHRRPPAPELLPVGPKATE